MNTFPLNDALPSKRYHPKIREISIDNSDIMNTNELKRQKVTNAPNPNETKFIDINVDCQEAIFQYLTISDLVNVVETHANLTEAAGIVFTKSYKSKTFKINGMRCAFGGSYTTHVIKMNCIEINDQRLCSNVLQHFGAHIKRISINYHGLESSQKFIRNFHTELQTFCKDTLISLEIKNCCAFLIDQTFVALRELIINNSILQSHAKQLFPNLNRLQLLGNSVNGCTILEHNYPDLDHLALEISLKSFSPTTVLSALHRYQHISSLHLVASEVDWSFFHLVSELTNNLRSLHLHICSIDFIDQLDQPDQLMVLFKSITKIEITMDRDPFDDLQLNFVGIKELSLIVNANIGPGFIDFITRNHQLENLTIIAPNWNDIKLTDIDLHTITTQLLHLRELELRNCSVPVAAALRLPHECVTLKRFGFTRANKISQKIVRLLEQDWSMTTDKTGAFGQFYLCTRK